MKQYRISFSVQQQTIRKPGKTHDLVLCLKRVFFFRLITCQTILSNSGYSSLSKIYFELCSLTITILFFQAPLVLAELLFDQNILAQVKKYRLLILRFTLNDKKAQRYLMGGLEQVIAMHRDKLMSKVPGLLKVFYDMDILGEPCLVEWADKVDFRYFAVHKKKTLMYRYSVVLLAVVVSSDCLRSSVSIRYDSVKKGKIWFIAQLRYY
nr:unnamed protein product [Callosobruchus analis]